MSRIRSIKPEFWSSEQVMECSPNARLLFIGIWNFADDFGRFPASARQLKALIFAGDDISSESVRGMLTELSVNGLLLLYEVSGKDFLVVTGWHHQKIEKRGKAKYPEPPPIDPSPRPHRLLPDHSVTERDIGKGSFLAKESPAGEVVNLPRASAHTREGTGR